MISDTTSAPMMIAAIIPARQRSDMPWLCFVTPDFSPNEDINVWLESNGRYMFTFADCGGSKCIWEENNELVLGSPCVATNNKATFQYYINPSAGTGGFQNYGTNLWMLMWATLGDNAILHTWDYPYSDLALSPA